MNENREKAVDRDEEAEGFLGEAEKVNGDDAADADERLVNRVEAAGGGPVEVFARVMDGAKAPEEWHRGGAAMAPLGAEFGDKNRDQKLRPARECEQSLLKRRVSQEAEGWDENEGDEERKDLADAAGDEEVGDIGPSAAAVPKLAADDGEERLKRDEEREENDEAEDEAGRVLEFGARGGVGAGSR